MGFVSVNILSSLLKNLEGVRKDRLKEAVLTSTEQLRFSANIREKHLYVRNVIFGSI